MPEFLVPGTRIDMLGRAPCLLNRHVIFASGTDAGILWPCCGLNPRHTHTQDRGRYEHDRKLAR